MKKFVCVCLFMSCFAFVTNAGVTFLAGTESSVGGSSKSNKKATIIASDKKCINEGYRLTSCAKGLKGVDVCPYKKGYYKSCCSEEYKFTKEECLKHGLEYSSKTCGGMHMCM